MSAIWGIISFDGNISSDIVEKMQKPYKEKCKIERYESIQQSNIFMGCGIQYITKESQKEKLPIKSTDGKVYFTTDCILDNREALITELNAPKDEPDGTLMYLAYMKWGMECLNHFRGLFSMAVYDAVNEKIYLAADQAACRCLYYYSWKGKFAFSTLISSITNSFPEIPVNELYIKDYLTAPGLMPNVVYKETPYKNIFKLSPGCFLEISKENIIQHQYWDPMKNSPKINAKSPKQYGDVFLQTYDHCVKSAVRTSGEIGILLSSGLDSSSVGALAARALAKVNKSLYTYTYIPIKDMTSSARRTDIVNEKTDVLSLVEMYPNMIPHFTTNNGENCYKSIPKVLQILEMPYKSMVNSPSLMEIYEKAAESGCKIVLSGQCGNSTVSYGYIDDILYDLYKNRRFIKCLKYLNHFSTTVKESRKKALKNCIGYFRATSKSYKVLNDFHYNPQNVFLSSNILDDYPMKDRYLSAGVNRFEYSPTPKEMYGDYLYKLAALCYLGEIDTKMGLAYGILLRDPTRDSRIMSFCSKLPYHMFAYGGTPRWLICGNFHKLLPEQFMNNYLRYGLQNADWFYRICRDWKTVFPDINNCLSFAQIQPYINKNKIEQYLDKLKSNLNPNDKTYTEQLFFICICSHFLSKIEC